MLADLRFVFRQLSRAPAFTVTAILTLAIGIGANIGVFSIVNGFLRPLPVPHADRIVVLAADTEGDDTGFRYRFSYPDFADYQKETSAFSDVLASTLVVEGLTVDGKSSEFVGQAVTGNFFDGLGVVPAIGRLFRPGEGEGPGAEEVMVLGYSYWQRRFGARTDVIGQLVRLDGVAVRIIGVAAPRFRGTFESVDINGYVPLVNLRVWGRNADRIFSDRAYAYLTIFARLKPRISLAAGRADAETVAARLAADYPAIDKGVHVRVVPEPFARPMPITFFETIEPFIRGLLFVLATIVLGLACLNVANLLLVRATVRQRELAVRAALGSSRGRLLRLLLVESVLLSTAGALAGVLLGRASGEVFVRSVNVALDLPIVLDVTFDWRVFSYALAVATATALFVGLLPGIRATRTRVGDLLHDGDRAGSAGPERQRLRRTLVVAQVAGALVLLVMAGLFVRNLQRVERIDLGFDSAHLLTMRLDPSEAGYDMDRTATFYDDLERRVRAVPGVDHAALSYTVPMGYVFGSCPLEPEGAATTDDAGRLSAAYNDVGTEYFDTLRLPMARGRTFDERDTSTSMPVVIVNETLAARLWPGENPIGRRIKVLCATPVVLWQVVGVARDSKYVAVFERPLPYLYLPLAQTQPSLRTLQIRSNLAPDDLARRVRREVDALNPEIPLSDVRTMDDAIAGSFGYVLFRVGASQAAVLGVLGLVLAVVGIYGVVSYGASQRTREIGVRIALGASPRDVRGLILGQGARLVVAGVASGLAVSLAVVFLLARVLVIGGAFDPVTFAVVTVGLVVVALLACYLPARRATRVDPVHALRHE